MPFRIQSASSINTHKQCPRKYYYSYIEELPQLPSIHTIRGHIAHKVLENFFDEHFEGLSAKNCQALFQEAVQRLLLKYWAESKDEIDKLDLMEEQKLFYFEETMLMLGNWAHQMAERIKHAEKPLEEWKRITPEREQLYVSERFSVRGFIDAIEKDGGKVTIIDYKTSKSEEINNAYRLQLAIYALLYFEKHGKLPDKVGIFFLKSKPQFLDVDEQLLRLAKREVELIHFNTKSDKIEHYPRRPSALCKWKMGKCDFYDICRPFGPDIDEESKL